MDSGNVLWITGLSGAGKSTVAGAVVHQLRHRRLSGLLLDGDSVRTAIADPMVAYDAASRLANAYRIARLAGLIAGQGLIVVVSTMSLFREIHVWNRQQLPGYYEVLLEADIQVRMKRDPKGLYARAMEGSQTNVVGVDLSGELPLAPHLTIVNEGGTRDVSKVAQSIVDAFLLWRRAGMPARGQKQRLSAAKKGT